MELTRRSFIGTTAAAVVAASATGKSPLFGANDAVQVCVCGVNGRGKSHIEGFQGQDGCEVVALCDPDSRVLKARARDFEKRYGRAVKTYADIREALQDESIDAITIATPNHWHSLMAIWGVQAGKDVYVEKPLSHNVWEGRQLAAAAEKYDRVVMHGTQSRSDPRWMRDIGLLQSGFIGAVHKAKGFTYKTGNRRPIGHGKDVDAPDNLDWTLWQGPAEEEQYRALVEGKGGLLVHYDWHWFWNYGNGETGNQGVHQMDLGVWGMNKGLPVKVYSTGGRYAWDDDGETPNTQVSTFTYADGTIYEFEIRNIGSYQEAGRLTTGNTFLCADGYYVEGMGFFNYKNEPIKVEMAAPKSDGNWGNFLNAVRSRKQEDIRGTALEGHLSCVHCHIANIAYRLGHSLEFDPKTERFVGDKAANSQIARSYRKGFEVPKLA